MKFFHIFLFIPFHILFADDSWKKYPYHQENSKIVFPQDEGRHDSFPNLEWWYAVIHGKGEITGEHYSILVTHFNNRFRFFTVANLDRKTHTSGTAMGKLISKKGYLDLKHKTKYGIDIFRSAKDENGKLIPFEYEIKTYHDKMKLQIYLKSLKRPLMVGETGYTPVGSSGHSWYYSLTRLDAIGELTLNGFTEKIIGQAWMDHQWGPFIVSPVQIGKTFESYEWFCLQLENGTDIMISNIYNRNFEIPMTKPYGRVELIDKNGKSKSIIKRSFERTRFWQDPISGHFMSMGWRLRIPEWELDLEMNPDFPDQMVRFPLRGDFWEGSIKVAGQLAGRQVKGKAFGELIHRFEKPILKISKIKIDHENAQLNISWKVKNKDAGNPLTYDISIVTANGYFTLLKDLLSTSISIPLSKLQLPLSGSFKLKIEGKSIDGLLSGEIHTKSIHI